VFDQRYKVKRKPGKILLSRLLKAKDFDSISYAGRVMKEDEKA
jgi:hypothetical protein